MYFRVFEFGHGNCDTHYLNITILNTINLQVVQVGLFRHLKGHFKSCSLVFQKCLLFICCVCLQEFFFPANYTISYCPELLREIIFALLTFVSSWSYLLTTFCLTFCLCSDLSNNQAPAVVDILMSSLFFVCK